MEANELRIGNWIKSTEDYEPNVYQVEEIRREEKNGSLGISYRKGSCWALIEEDGLIMSIPLTEEWLIKLGGKSLGNKSYRFGVIGDNIVMTYDADKNLTYNGLSSTKEEERIIIKTVHRLQNYFYALKERELTLNEDTNGR